MTTSSTTDITAIYGRRALAPLTVRIAVAGHRPNQLLGRNEDLKSAIARLAVDLTAIAGELCSGPDARLLYDVNSGGPCLRVISALAEGSDRVAALVAMEHGFELYVILPCPQEEYEQDFSATNSVEAPGHGTVAAFRELQNRAAAVLALEGRAGHEGGPREMIYQRLAKEIVSHCDVLIAIWDGLPARGQGGTQEVVDHAKLRGVPILWIDPAQPKYPLLVLPKPSWGQGEAKPYERDDLTAYLRGRYLPAGLNATGGQQLREFAAERGFVVDWERAPDFASKGPLLLRGGLRKSTRTEPDGAREVRTGSASPRSKVPVEPKLLSGGDNHANELAPASPASHRYFSAFLRADQLASRYGRRTRAAFVTIFLLAAVAVACAAASLVYGHVSVIDAWHVTLKHVFTLLELVVLTFIAALVVLDRVLHWHRRWMDYRLLAEVLRPMPAVAALGSTIPTDLIERAERGSVDRDHLSATTRVQDGKKRERVTSWVFAYLESIVRYAGVPATTQRKETLEHVRNFAAERLIGSQITYHRKKAARSLKLDARLAKASMALFALTFAAIALKFALLSAGDYGTVGTHLGFLATILPAMAATCFGVRSHLEFGLVAHRSDAMAEELEAVRHDLSALQEAKLNASAILDGIRRAADLMVSEASSWVKIFRLKEVELA